MPKLIGKVDYVGPSIVPDNEINLINEIFEIVRYSDNDYQAKVFRKEDEMIVHITPSNHEHKQPIIDNLLYINRNIGTKIRFSSSLKISKIISFRISQQHVSL